MNYRNLILVALLACSILKAQAQSVKIDVLKSSGYKSNLKKHSYFLSGRPPMYYLEKEIDTSDIHFIATIKAITTKKHVTLIELYEKIIINANKLGANCFKPLNFIAVNDSALIMLNFYYADTNVIKKNEALHEKNMVYIIGNFNENEKTVQIKINDSLKTINPGFFYKQNLLFNKNTKFEQKGFMGASISVKASNNAAYILPITGFGNGRSSAMISGGLGIKTSLNFIETNLGLLLIHFLKQQIE